MPLVSAAAAAQSAPAVFDLKSASLTLLALLLKTTDLKALGQAMAQRLGETPDVFSHDPVLIDLSAVADAGEIDFNALTALLKRYKLLPAGVRGGSAGQMAHALAAGLGEAPDAGPAPARSEPRVETVEVIREVPVEVEVVREVAAPAARTVIVDKPLRSGQQVYAKGADLVVLAVVSHGAEVIADGSIHVYAPLRGKAIAGAQGNTEARIFAAVMEPQLVSIAGIYRAIEAPLAPDVQGKAAQIRLDGEKLLMEALHY
jgi:septum site-determining protein MinC